MRVLYLLYRIPRFQSRNVVRTSDKDQAVKVTAAVRKIDGLKVISENEVPGEAER